VPLNARGRAQARRVAARLATVPIAAVYASPLARTLATARAIARPHGLAVRAEPALLDLDYGAWQGRTPKAVERADPALFRLWRERPALARIPGGETLAQLARRVTRLVARLEHEWRGATVVLVSHDIVARVLVARVLGLALDHVWRLAPGTASITVIERRSRTLVVRRFGDTAHLDT